MSNLISFSLGNAAALIAAAAFLIGAVVNASASKPIREEFVRYGFPWWWCWVTALLEFTTAVLLLLRPTFTLGVVLGVCIMVAAIFAIVRARDYRHIPPPAIFLLLLVIAASIQFS
jgi:heme A synthase